MSEPAAAPPRWIPLLTVILAVLGLTGTVGGLVLTVGAWRAQVDVKLEDHEKRIAKAERNQETYIPVLLGLTKDIAYLVDRARREDDRRERERR